MTRLRFLILAACLLRLASTLPGAVAAGETDSPLEAQQAIALRLSLDGLPLLAFGEGPVGLEPILYLDREPPKEAAKRETTRRAVSVTCSGAHGEGAEATREIQLPPYRDEPAGVRFLAEAEDLGHEREILFRATDGSDRTVEERVVVYWTHLACPPVVFENERFRDGEGRRVLFLVPPVDPMALRRWRPLRVLERTCRGTHEVAWFSPLAGRGPLGRELRNALGTRGWMLGPVSTDGEGTPVYRFFLAALNEARSAPLTVLLDPGGGDARFGTPVAEYYLALHGAAAALARRGNLVRRMFLLTPPLEGTGRTRYGDCLERVGRERSLSLLPLAGTEGDADGTAGALQPRYPDPARAKRRAARIAARLARPYERMLTGGALTVFLLFMLMLLWLRVRVRFSLPPDDGRAPILADADAPA
jgi:hypothetical protein